MHSNTNCKSDLSSFDGSPTNSIIVDDEGDTGDKQDDKRRPTPVDSKQGISLFVSGEDSIILIPYKGDGSESDPSGSDWSASHKQRPVVDDDDDGDDDDGDGNNDNNDNDNDKQTSSSTKAKQKMISNHKPGRTSAEETELVQKFSKKVFSMADELAERLRMPRKKLLVKSGLGIKESCAVNTANLHCQWFAATHPKPDNSRSVLWHLFAILTSSTVSKKDYGHLIAEDYRKRTEGYTPKEKSDNLRDVSIWASHRYELDEGGNHKTTVKQFQYIQEKFTNLVSPPFPIHTSWV